MLVGRTVKKLLKAEQYDEIKKMAAADALTRLKAIGQLIALLRSADMNTRTRAAGMFAEMNEPSAIPGLLNIVRQGISADKPSHLDYSYHIHHYLAVDRYIDTNGYERKIPFFDWAFQNYPGSNKPDVLSATRAIRAIAYSADFQPLLGSLKHADTETRELTAEILMKRSREIPEANSAEAIKALLDASKQDGSLDVRRYARLALRNMGSKATAPLAEALKDPDSQQRYYIAWTLYWLWAQYGDRCALEPILAAWDKKDIAVIAGAYYYFLEKGEDGTEYLLIEALNRYGQKEMVEDYLNCGNTELEKAATAWAYAHNFSVRKSQFGSRRQWGSKRT